MARTIAGGRSALLAFALLAAAGTAAFAQERSSPSIRHLSAEPAEPVSAQGCAADYHLRLGEIAARELVAYREASATIGAVDPALPGRLVFAATRRPDLEPEARQALDLATNLARRQGRTSFARDANTKWIAERIREDLTDYLRQKPTPFLCAGLTPYLATLQTYANQGAPSPAAVGPALETQIVVASRSLDAAFRAMRPAPLPRFAPADRPSGPAIDGLRLAMESGLREEKLAGEPTLLAERAPETKISDSSIDPDLPPIDRAHVRALTTEADRMRALTALVGTLARRGHLERPEPAEPDLAASRPMLSRLTSLRTHMERPAGRIADPIVRQSVETALSDLEALDYLAAAVDGTADPLTHAMYATMDAIRSAHAQSCGCTD